MQNNLIKDYESNLFLTKGFTGKFIFTDKKLKKDILTFKHRSK
tara:strand:- start:1385 stop:1513 length:129 start_codon:yes stop_codon:yes gene_type:complete